jgi:hypothetical protein
LDITLSNFLQLLSPYASEHSAHTVLEFLIRRYRINEINADALIRCVIPYHDTKIFAKVVELSNIAGTMWVFLEGVKQSGSPMPRAMLTRVTKQNVSVLSALTSIASSALKTGAGANSANPLLTAGVNRIVSFYTAVMVELCENKALDDAQLRVLYPFLVDGIKGRASGSASCGQGMDVQRSRCSCIVLSQIARSTRLAAPFIGGVVAAMFSRIASEASQPSLPEEQSCAGDIIKCFAVFTQLQTVVLNKKLLDLLLTDGLSIFLSFADSLMALSSGFDLETAYESVFCGLVDCLIAAEGKPESESEGVDGYQGAVNHLLCSAQLPTRLVSVCADSIVQHSLKLMHAASKKHGSKKGSKTSPPALEHLGPIIRILLQRYPEEFNATIKSLQGAEPAGSAAEAEAAANELRKDLWQLLKGAGDLEDTLYGRGAGESGTSLLLALSHPSAEVRAAAMDTFDEAVSVEAAAEVPLGADVAGLVAAVLRNLCSEDESVCSRGWNDSIIGKVAAAAVPADLISCVVTAFQFWLEVALRKPKKDGRNIFSLILACLRTASFTHTLGEDMVGGMNVSFKIWLSSNLLALCSLEEDLSMRLAGADQDKSKKLVQRYASLQGDAVSALHALGGSGTVDLFNVKISKSKSLSYADLVAKIAARVATQVADRDSRAEESIRTLATLARATVADFASQNEEYFPENAVQKRNYLSLLTLLQSVCSLVAEQGSDPSQMPSVRSYFLCLHEIFASVLAAVVPVELGADYSSPFASHLVALYKGYLSNDFSSVLQTMADPAPATLGAFAASELRGNSADAILLLFFLSASTRHAEAATVLGPLLASGLTGKRAGSPAGMARLMTEAIAAPVGAAREELAMVFSKLQQFNIFFYDPMSGNPCSSLLCPDIFSDNSSNDSSITALSISAEAKIAACQALCSILPMVDLEEGAGVEAMAQSVATLCPLIVHLFSEQQSEFRQAGLYMCRQFLEIFKAQKKTMHFEVAFAADSNSCVKNISFTAGTVVEFCNTFLNSEELVSQDPARVTQILSDNVFADKSSKLDALRSLLLSSAVVFGWVAPAVTSGVFRALLLASGELACLPAGAWPSLKTLFTQGVVGEGGASAASVHEVFLSEIVLRCLKYASSEKANKTEAEVVASVVEMIGSGSGRVMYAPLLQWLALSGPDSGSDWLRAAGAASGVAVFRALLGNSLSTPGSPDVVSALALIPVNVDIVVEELLTHKKALAKAVKAGDYGDVEQEGNMDVVTYSNVASAAGDVASTLQAFYSALDALSPLIRRLTETTFSEGAAGAAQPFGTIVCIMFDILEICVDPRLASLLVIEYCKGVVLDTIKNILHAFGTSVSNASSGKAKTPKKAKAEAALLGGAYSAERMQTDTDTLFRVLQGSKMHHTQGSVLAVLNAFMIISPKVVSAHAISALSEILAGTTLAATSQRDGLAAAGDSAGTLLRSVLSTLTRFISAGEAGAVPAWDRVVQPLFAHFQAVSQHRRASLVRIAVEVLGEGCLDACTTALLIHSFAHFFNVEDIAVGASANANKDGMDIVAQPEVFTAVISRNAGKKANRVTLASVSQSQEMYQLALNTFLACSSPVEQTATLVSLMTTATELFEYGLEMCRSGKAATKNEKFSYAASLLKVHRGSAAAVADPIKLAVLHLQFVYSVLESGAYHRVLAPHTAGWIDIQTSAAAPSPQEYFVMLCERSLKFLAASVNAQQMETRDNVSYDGVSLTHLSKEAWTYCVNIIESMQRLLDGPAFLGVLQELLCHPQSAVRQKALQILASRLRQLADEKDDVESSLYVDLIQRIKESVENAVELFSDSKGLKDDKTASHVISLAQSGVLCIELLAGHVNKDKESLWHPKLEECLHVQLTLIASITGSTIGESSVSVSVGDSLCSELLRLQGSCFLCCVSLCATIGTKVLPRLGGLLKTIILNIKSHSGALLSDSKRGKSSSIDVSHSEKKKKHSKSSQQNSSLAASMNVLATNRSRVLLLRSAVSAIASLSAALPNFMHPYIEECLITSLSVCQIKLRLDLIEGSNGAESGSVLDKDVYRSMVVMVGSIPPRLSVPRLAETARSLTKMLEEEALAAGSEEETVSPGLLVVLIRFVELLADHWSMLDRAAIAQSISQLGPLLISVMGLRCASRVQSPLTRTLDDRVADACVQLCMKLTEAEVRAFLVHAIEWVNASSEEDSSSDSDDASDASTPPLTWLKFAKTVSFFHCVSALNEKLKGVFTSTMGCIWELAADNLGDIVHTLQSGVLTAHKSRTEDNDASSSTGKKRKKDKELAAEAEAEERGERESARTIHELVLLGTDIMLSLKRCCVYDKVGFIDEVCTTKTN